MFRLLLITLPFLLSLQTLLPQTTRAELLRTKRLEKKAHSEPGENHPVEKALIFIEKTGFAEFFDVEYKNIHPKVGSIVNGSGIAFGARYWLPNVGGSRLSLQASAQNSIRNYRQFDFQFGRMKTSGAQIYDFPLSSTGLFSNPFPETEPETHNFFYYADLRYRSLPQLDFFGTGNDSRRENESNFELVESSFDFVTGYSWKDRIGLAFRAGLITVDIDDGEDEEFPSTLAIFTEDELPGVTEQPDLLYVGVATWLDMTQFDGSARRGGMLFLSFANFSDRGDNLFAFTRAQVDSRNYIPLGSPQRTLALRVFTSLDTPRKNSRVPFYFQNTLGGNNRLRGYPDYRFRDENLVYLSGEYRWRPLPAWEFALFYDMGKVFPSRADFDFDHFKKSIGWGVRFKNPRNVFLRFDVARSEEGTVVHLSFAPAF